MSVINMIRNFRYEDDFLSSFDSNLEILKDSKQILLDNLNDVDYDVDNCFRLIDRLGYIDLLNNLDSIKTEKLLDEKITAKHVKMFDDVKDLAKLLFDVSEENYAKINTKYLAKVYNIYNNL